MKIHIIRPVKDCNGVKLYAGMPSKINGEFYAVVYIRTSQMKRWLCTCYDQIFRQTGRRRNCKHIRAVRKQVGL